MQPGSQCENGALYTAHRADDDEDDLPVPRDCGCDDPAFAAATRVRLRRAQRPGSRAAAAADKPAQAPPPAEPPNADEKRAIEKKMTELASRVDALAAQESGPIAAGRRRHLPESGRIHPALPRGVRHQGVHREHHVRARHRPDARQGARGRRSVLAETKGPCDSRLRLASGRQRPAVRLDDPGVLRRHQARAPRYLAARNQQNAERSRVHHPAGAATGRSLPSRTTFRSSRSGGPTCRTAGRARRTCSNRSPRCSSATTSIPSGSCCADSRWAARARGTLACIIPGNGRRLKRERATPRPAATAAETSCRRTRKRCCTTTTRSTTRSTPSTRPRSGTAARTTRSFRRR